MYIGLVIASSLIAVASITVYLISLMIQNYKRQQFFKLKSPNLPVLPNTSLFTGNSMDFIHSPKSWLLMDEHHKKYGKSVGGFCADIPILMTTDLELIKTYLLDEPSAHINRMRHHLPVKVIESDNIMFARDEQWLRLRKAIAPSFSNFNIKSATVQMEILQVIEKFLESLDKRLEDAAMNSEGENSILIDANDYFRRYTLALVFTSFYKQTDIVDFEGEKDYYSELILKGLKQSMSIFMWLPTYVPALKPLCRWIVSTFDPFTKQLENFVGQQTVQNFEAKKQLIRLERDMKRGDVDPDNLLLADGTKFRRNMIDHIIDQFYEGKITAKEYINTSVFLFAAANHTSADAISILIYFLVCYPQVQEKLRDSIISEGVESEYLSWVINESLRLYPPSLVGGHREITRDIKTDVGVIPAGTAVFPSVFTIHRMKEYWGEDAEEFRPERWANAKSFHPVQFLTLGIGKRNCPGGNFAIIEMKMLLCAMLPKFKIEKSEKMIEEEILPFQSPFLTIILFDEPIYVRISHYERNNK